MIQHTFVFFEIDADHHLRTLVKDLAGAAHEAASFMRFEISERRSREEADLRLRLDLVGQGEGRGKIGRHRIDVERGEIPAQRVGLGFQEFAGNIHRHVGAEFAFVQ